MPRKRPHGDIVLRPRHYDTWPGGVSTDDAAMHRLAELIGFLRTAAGKRVLRDAHREAMLYKREQYRTLLTEAQADVRRERELVDLKIPDLKRISRVTGDHDNWQIFESVSRKYLEAQDRASIFDALRTRAERRLEQLEETTDEALTAPLLDALGRLHDFQSQPHIVGTVVDVVGAFLKNPKLVRTKFLNFIVVGAAGTGKTTLAGCMAACFARVGMFVEDRVVPAGRAELVAEYEGQTVARTRHFLVSNLDRGVIFVDEAYGITPWNDGKPESYGSEAVTAMVEFMSRYKGLYCLILAGYEREMQRYFLATNPGLERRFPYRFVMRDLTPVQLVHVFQRTLLTEQALYVPPAETGEPLASVDYFTAEAWRYLLTVVGLATSGHVEVTPEEYDRATLTTYHNTYRFVPTYPHMHCLFANQAGSMTNLAEECITVLMSCLPFADTATRRPRGQRSGLPPQQGVAVMKRVLRRRVVNSAMSSAPLYLRELHAMESARV